MSQRTQASFSSPNRAYTTQETLAALESLGFTIKKRRPGQLAQRLTLGAAVAVFLVGTGIAVQTFIANKQITGNHASAESEAVVTAPDEDQPSQSDVNGYTVAPDSPRLLQIPKLGVNARIRAMGTTANGQLQSPSNIFDVGWYKDTVKPGGAGGTTLIDGHVTGPTKRGVFYDLKLLAVGDKVVVERGDGKRISYHVVAIEKYDANKMDMTKALVSKNSAKPGLNLITCTGIVKPGTNNYDQRLLVYTEAD